MSDIPVVADPHPDDLMDTLWARLKSARAELHGLRIQADAKAAINEPCPTIESSIDAVVATISATKSALRRVEKAEGLVFGNGLDARDMLRGVQRRLQDVWDDIEAAGAIDDHSIAPAMWNRFHRIEARLERPLLAAIRSIPNEDEIDAA